MPMKTNTNDNLAKYEGKRNYIKTFQTVQIVKQICKINHLREYMPDFYQVS